MPTSLSALATQVASALAYPTEFYAVLAVVGVLAVTALVTWLIVRIMFVRFETAFEPYEVVLQSQLALVAGQLATAALAATAGARDAFFSVLDLAKSTFGTFLPIFVLAAVSLAYLEAQPYMAESYLSLRQVTINPALEALALPLLNLGRLLFDVAWPLVNFGAQLGRYLMRGQFEILFACVSYGDLQALLAELAGAVTEATTALATWLSLGVFDDSYRFDLLPALLRVGTFFNLLTEPLTCFCAFLAPLWTAVTTLPQLTSFQTGIDCATNVPVRLFQAVMRFFSYGFYDPLNLDKATVELNCAVVAFGETAEDSVVVVVDMLYDFLVEIIQLLSVAAGPAAAAAANSTTNTTAAAEARTHTLSVAVHGALRTAAPDAVQGASFWRAPLTPDLVNSTIGLQALFALLAAPWSHAVTEPVAAAASILNMTVAALMHPTCPSTCDCLLDSPLGLRFLQLGPVADRLRAAVDAASQVLGAFLVEGMPALVSRLGQAGITMAEALLEFLFGWLYAIFFPTWMPGNSPPSTQCNYCPTTCPLDQTNVSDPGNWPAANGTWTLFSFWPAYYDWNESALARSRQLLLDDADALAVTLGCNLTLPPTGNSSIDDCAEYPGQCFLRRLYQTAVELLRLTEQFVLYVPDLVLFDFDQSNRTWASLDPRPFVLRLNQTVDCLTSWIDELDGDDHCLSNTQPYGGYDPDLFSNTTMPEPEPFTTLSLNTSLFCHNDSLYYYPDGRLFILKENASAPRRAVTCDPLATNNGCEQAYGSRNGTDYYLTISGSPPAENINISIAPRASGMKPVPIFANTAGSYAMLPPDPPDYALYNITAIQIDDCTGVGTLPDPLPPGLACASNAYFSEGDPDNFYRWLFYREQEPAAGTLQKMGPVFLCAVQPTWTPSGFFTCPPINTLQWNSLANMTQNPLFCLQEFPPQIKFDAINGCGGSWSTSPAKYSVAQYTGTGLPAFLKAYRSNQLQFTPYCVSNALDGVGPFQSMCRYNQLNRIDIRQTYTPANITYPYYVDGFPQSRLPCDIRFAGQIAGGFGTGDYQCVNGLASPYEVLGQRVYWMYYKDANPAQPLPINCTQNYVKTAYPPAPAPPLCKRMRISWLAPGNVYLNATIQLDGTNIRVRFNDTAASLLQQSWTFDQTLVCAQRYSGTAVANTSETGARFWASLAAGQLVNVATANSDPYATIFKPNPPSTYRKDNLICSLSYAVHCAGEFLVAILSEVAMTWQSILVFLVTVAQNPPGDTTVPWAFSWNVPPTFEDARDKLRCALCSLATAITRVFPFNLDCDNGNVPVMQCDNEADCASGFLCSVVDLLMFAIDVVIEVLRTVRQLINNQAPTSQLTATNDCSSFTDAFGCFVNLIAYLIKKLVHAFLQCIRAFVANVNCLICAITGTGGSCTPLLYTTVNTLVTLIDGFVNDALVYLIKFLVAMLQFVINFFTGQWGTAFGTNLVAAFKAIGDLLASFAETLFSAIVKFLESIPILGDIVRFILTLVQGACGLVQGVLDLFSSDAPDLGCDNIQSRKKRAALGAWMPPMDEVTRVWATDAPGCAARAGAYLNTSAFDYAAPAPTALDEWLYCMSAPFWLVPAAAASDVVVVGTEHMCDQRMPPLYRSGRTWPALSDEERGVTKTCVLPRLMAEAGRRSAAGLNGTWVPHDLFYNPLVRVPLLLDDLMYGYTVYSQYASDRELPVETVAATAAYARNWADSGYDTSHLEALAAAAVVGGDAQVLNGTLASTYLAADDRALGLALDQYAARATLTAATGASSWRRRSAATVNGTAQFWRTLFGVTGDAGAAAAARKRSVAGGAGVTSLLSNLTDAVLRRLAARHIVPAPLYTGMLSLTVQAAATPERRAQWTTSVTRSLLTDAVVLGARFWVNASDAGLATQAGAALGQLAEGAVAATRMLRDLTGTGDAGAGSVQLAWRRTPGNATLGAVMRAAASTLQASLTGLWRAGPAQLSALVSRLMTASPAAAARRARLSALVASATQAWRSGGARNASSSVAPLSVNGSIAAVECLIDDPALCSNCTWLANWVGTVSNAASLAVAYWTGPLAQEPSLNYSLVQYNALAAYLNNPAAPVVVGDSPALPVRWPHPDFAALRWFGDPTPNKLRFSDLAGLWDMLYGTVVNATDETVSLAARSGALADGDATMDGALASLYVSAIVGSGRNGSGVVRAHAVAPPNATTGLGGWLAFLYRGVRSCDFASDLDGSQKRFSIGEAVLITGAVGLGVSFVVLLPLLGNAVAALVAALGVSLLTVAFFTLFFAYSYSTRCLPALPFQLADDLMYFLVHTLWPRCDWLFAGGYVANATYTNDNCYDPALYINGEFSCVSCKHDVGFKDFGYYVAFWMTRYWPAAVDWLQTTTLPVLADLRSYDAVDTRLHAFDAFNASDPVAYSTHLRCAHGETALASFCIALAYALLLSLLRPLIGYLLSLLAALLAVAAYVALLAGTTFVSVMSVPAAIAADPQYREEKYTTVADGEAKRHKREAAKDYEMLTLVR